jgi:methionyl-tRNA formyltransferase
VRAIFLGRKPTGCDALRRMIASGVDVAAVVTTSHPELDLYQEKVSDVAHAGGIPTLDDRELYAALARSPRERTLCFDGIDLVVSVLHDRRILPPLLTLGQLGCINFHPAPLPEYRGWAVYQQAVLDNVQQWGASAHFVDEDFDSGPVIAVESFAVDASRETAHSLAQKTHPVLVQLFDRVLRRVLSDGRLEAKPQGRGRMCRKADVLPLRYIHATDSPETVDRKIRAFWYPPHPPAQIEVHGTWHAVINPQIYKQLGRAVCRGLL